MEAIQPAADIGSALTVTRIKRGAWLGVGQVQPTFASDQKFAADRAFAFKQVNIQPALAGSFGSHQTGRAATNDGKTRGR